MKMKIQRLYKKILIFTCIPKNTWFYFFKILFKSIIEEKNGIKIKSYLETSEKIKLNYLTITKILLWISRCLAYYLKGHSRFNKLGRINRGRLISMDKSNFVNIEGIKIWIIDAKNNNTNNIRLDVFQTHSEEDYKTFIYKIIMIIKFNFILLLNLLSLIIV